MLRQSALDLLVDGRRLPAAAALPALAAATALASFWQPGLALPAALAAAALAGRRLLRHDGVDSRWGQPPLRLPERGPDEGRWFLGTSRDGQGQVWLSDGDMRGHVAVVGTAGSGKTEHMIGLAANALWRGSGCLFVDGKGDVSHWAKMVALAASCGRRDDLLVLNLLDAGRHADTCVPARTHRFNPLAHGDGPALARLVSEMVDDGWPSGRKIAVRAFLDGLMTVLVALRPAKGLGLAKLSSWLAPGRVSGLASVVEGLGIHPDATSPLRAYLASLPADPDAARALHDGNMLPVRDMLDGVLSRYGHALCDGAGDVDLADVVGSRRILVVLLPSLGKTARHAAAFGRMLLSSLDTAIAAMATGPSAHRAAPFLTILDEVGYYALPNMASLGERARAANVSLVNGVQDMHGLEVLGRLSPAHGSPFRTCMLMRVEDQDMAKLAMGLCRAAVGPGDLVDLVDQVNFRDIKGQREGQFLLFTPIGIDRIDAFYANPSVLVDDRAMRAHGLGPDALVPFARDEDRIERRGGVA